MRYLILDCEMGGRDLKYSLLTAYFGVYSKTFELLGELDLKVKPDDGDYVLNGKAMGVNHINISEHDKTAICYKEAGTQLYYFLRTFAWGIWEQDKILHERMRLTPVGHGVRGDIDHILKLISWGSWEQFCTYHYIDTSVALQFLRATKHMPEDEDGSLEALAKYFEIEVQGVLHNARTDAHINARVLQAMIKKMTVPLKQ